MKSLIELKFFVRDFLLSDLKTLESEREKVVKKISIAILLITGIFCAIYYYLPADIFLNIIQLVIFGYIALVSMIYYFLKKKYSSNYKDLIIGRIIKFLDPNLTYEKTSCINQTEFEKSEIFLSDITSFKGDDLVSGFIDQTKIEFSELNVEKVTGSGKHRRRVTVFKGLFLIADFPKNFTKKTFVLPDFAERLFGVFGSFLQSKSWGRPDLVKLENPEFEKNFAVYSEDQIEARYILSTTLMERILAFKKKCKRNIHLSFIENKVYIAIKYTKNLFEPQVFKTLYNFEPIQEYYEDLCVAIGIVEDLHLNLNIWNTTKPILPIENIAEQPVLK